MQRISISKQHPVWSKCCRVRYGREKENKQCTWTRNIIHLQQSQASDINNDIEEQHGRFPCVRLSLLSSMQFVHVLTNAAWISNVPTVEEGLNQLISLIHSLAAIVLYLATCIPVFKPAWIERPRLVAYLFSCLGSRLSLVMTVSHLSDSHAPSLYDKSSNYVRVPFWDSFWKCSSFFSFFFFPFLLE